MRYGTSLVLKGVDLAVMPNAVTAIIGPSGCGKSTFMRCLSRMHETVAGARAEGQVVLLSGEDLYARGVDPADVRRRIGMVFQKPNPFPTMTIFENVATGLRLAGVRARRRLQQEVERALRQAVLKAGSSLSGGQQQRLCIARTLAVEPQILLMDEPCSALDPGATAKIEELIHDLKKDLTVVIVTHNMQQAARVSERTGFFLMVELIEFGVTKELFTTPRDRQTEDYITGRFG